MTKNISMGQYYIYFFQQSLLLTLSYFMLTTFYRIGPLFCFELVLIGAALFFYICDFNSCYSVSFIQFALQFYVLEMIFSLRMIKQSTILRKNQIQNIIKEPNWKYFTRQTWNSAILLCVVLYLYTTLVQDGVILAGVKPEDCQQESNNRGCELQVTFNLYSLSLMQEIKTFESSFQELVVILWGLYICALFIISVLCIIFSREYYHYLMRLKNNRYLFKTIKMERQTLLDSFIYKINSQSMGSKPKYEKQCCICLEPLIMRKTMQSQNKIEIKIIILKCGHYYHENCLESWLDFKDNCPFRCDT